ncbi:anti-sigma factor [Sphingomonas sp. CFBP8993]|uniref:anti-sigma factor family protein n=1 Tax=Sphingomonas sp. CFBP8993 TaxID=3096526 RepID=UPI002A6A3FF8|nr:anti-sigma factor [Sphingomonas sp. CFBP8993]MDY0957562.1 anti-sigma factor [Sphingomonas sp. CFBP8993]
MTIEPELLMAYADDALDPLTAKRVERAVAADPALAEEVARHRRLRATIAQNYAPIASEPVPDRLAALLTSNVVPMPAPAPRTASRFALPHWRSAAAMAACLVVGVFVGQGLDWRFDQGPIAAKGDGLYAAGSLARALDDQASGGTGPVRVAVSFRASDNGFCRVFQSAQADGIACRDPQGWALRRTMPGTPPATNGGYAQAGSSDAELMAAAQNMMADMPLDAAGEKAAIAKDWRR